MPLKALFLVSNFMYAAIRLCCDSSCKYFFSPSKIIFYAIFMIFGNSIDIYAILALGYKSFAYFLYFRCNLKES